MPNMDGRSALTEMRRIRPALPALFVTGYDLGSDTSGDGLDTLQKPYSFDALSQKIREIMERGS
jgi:CheY-like chemotaxis protein